MSAVGFDIVVGVVWLREFVGVWGGLGCGAVGLCFSGGGFFSAFLCFGFELFVFDKNENDEYDDDEA